MLRATLFCIICVIGSLAFAQTTTRSSTEPKPGQIPELGRVIEQFRDFYIGGQTGERVTLSGTNETVATPGDAMRFATSLAEDGRWPDLQYASTAISEWPPAVHCARLLAMASASVMPSTGSDDRKALRSAIHRALGYWIQNDLICKNWWYNQIGIPKSLGTTAILLGDELTPEEYQYLTSRVMPRGKIGMTGQNRVWLAGNTLMLGLIQSDRQLVDKAAQTIWDEIRVTEKEGIQPDFSFHQHGPQQQFGNYGMAFAVEACRWGQILRETPWAMPSDKLAIYRDYLLNGQNWVSYRGAMDISACGRQLMPDSPRKKTATIARVMQSAASFDPSHAQDYLHFVSRNATADGENDLVGDRVFWRSDYFIQRQPQFCATLKMHSKRVIGSESLNSENLSGYYLSDGALYLYRQGDEYRDIFPLWDWRRLPGVTCAQSVHAPPHLTGASLKTDRTFVGGVTDGTLSCCAMDYDRDGLQAHKAWFFGENFVYCLGTAIHSIGDASIATTINQCLARGPVAVMATGKPSQLTTDQKSLDQVEWIEHDGLRYLFPQPCSVHCEVAKRTGNWHRVFDNPATPAGDVSKDVFTLWLDHGTKPTGASYAYAISPAGSGLTAKVLANSETDQAVAIADHRDAVIFWTPGKLTLGSGGEIEADQPCLLLVDTRTRRAMVADPTQLLTSITLTLGGEQKHVALPQQGSAGRSIEMRFE